MKEKNKKIIKNFIIKWQLIPSSKFLVNKMLSKIDYQNDKKILQLWFGTGVFTVEILKKLAKDSQLVVFEVREDCRKYYEKINDNRLIYIEDSAEYIEKYFKNEEFDCVFSTLPFTNFWKNLKDDIYNQILLHLKPNWKYLQYQYSLQSKKDITYFFDYKPKIDFTILNVPPAFIYEIEKKYT